MLEYEVTAEREDAHGSRARSKEAEIVLDTDLAGRPDAFNPAELLLAAVAACILKNVERVTPILKFQHQGVSVRVHGWREERPPRMGRIEYEILVTTSENDRRLELLHENVRKYGTIYNTVAAGAALTGVLRRA